MATNIKMTPDVTKEAIEAFVEYLRKTKIADGKINFTKTLNATDKKATLTFSELAWHKMQMLVSEYKSEVGWHGMARRSDTEENGYIVDDILVYPQKVAAATVTPDQVEYQNWLMGQPDEVFNSIRFQGHSHVDMGVTPSGVDTAFYDEILSQLDDTMFYIFMIVNKKGDKHVKIYDMAHNLYFGTSDVTVKIRNDGLGLENLLADAKTKVTQEVYTPKTGVVYSGAGYSSATGANRSGVSQLPLQDYSSKAQKKQSAAKPFGSSQTKSYNDLWADDGGYWGGEY